jgi:hypothetical protein
MRRTIIGMATAALVALAPGLAHAGGVSGAAFHVNAELYRTVGTLTDISGTQSAGALLRCDLRLRRAQLNVATAAPDDLGLRRPRDDRRLMNAAEP